MIEAAWCWVEGHAQLTAAFVAFLAFCVALSQFALSRKHNTRSVRPLLFHKAFTNVVPIERRDSGQSVITEQSAVTEYAVTLHNAGLGPAIIDSCVFGDTRGRLSDLNDGNLRAAIEEAFPDVSTRPEMSWTTIGSGTVIGKDETYELLRVKARNFQELAALTGAFAATEFHFVIGFSSLHDEKFVYDTRATPVRQRKQGWISRLFATDATVA